MPAKIIKEVPLPMPRSEISSPIQTRNKVPAVTVIIKVTVSKSDKLVIKL